MKRFVLLSVILAAVSVAAAAQDSRDADVSDRKRARNERAMQKRLEALQDSLDYAEAMDAIKRRDFVFESDMLVFKHGETARVFSNLNFVSLSGDKAVVQVSPFNSGGPNGLGGVTVDGRVIDIEERTDKRGNVFFSMNVMGRAISASVELNIAKGSNNASVRISPTMNSRTITLYGKIVPREKSNIFKGMTL